MKTPIIIYIFLVLCTYQGVSQISLPKQFNCIKSEDGFRFDYFSDGTYHFQTEAWGNGIESPDELKPYLEEVYDRKILFRKTKDKLYWGTGLFKGIYYYIVVIPESMATVTLSSPKNGAQFSNYSTWLLQEVRKNRSAEKDYYLTNYKGRTCR